MVLKGGYNAVMGRALLSVVAVIVIAILASYGLVLYSAKGTERTVSTPTSTPSAVN